MTTPTEPENDADQTSLSDEELTVASGGKGSDGDQIVIAETGMNPGVIA